MSTIAELAADDEELASEVQTLITAYIALKNAQPGPLSPGDQAAVDAADALVRSTVSDVSNTLAPVAPFNPADPAFTTFQLEQDALFTYNQGKDVSQQAPSLTFDQVNALRIAAGLAGYDESERV